MTELPESTFGLIVGGGPVGITTALALARYGYDCVVLERHAERLGQPKAHVLNPRTLEIFRQLNVDITPLRDCGLPPNEASVIRFVSSMNGPEFGSIDCTQDQTLLISPEPVLNVPQPHLEEYLLRTALATGKVTFLRMQEWKGCSEEPDKTIVSQVQCRKTNTVTNIRSKYLIGCDGAKAKSREALQIKFQSLYDVEKVLHYASVHFSADLRHKKKGLLWFVLNPASSGVFIAYNRKNSWVFFTQYDPLTIPKETFTSEYVKSRVFEAIGEPLPDYKELGITLWTTSPKLAETYRSTKVCNAFLAGDSAHSFPPTGGLGVNTGVGDVHNLIWKIHAVEQGWAKESFLDTVSSERLPIAKDNCRQSKINEDKVLRLIHIIQRPGTTAEELLADPVSRKQIQDAIDDNHEHFHSLNLQLGYVYGRAHTRPPSDYQKELLPGARLPHIWLENEDRKISSLDLVDGSGFVLITPDRFTNMKRLDCDGTLVAIKQLNEDFNDVYGDWHKLIISVENAALLVRPDQHLVGTISSIEQVWMALVDFYGHGNS